MEKKIKNCEVLDDWSALLPREAYKSLKKVPVKESWFDVYELPHNVYGIYEGGHFQEVLSFLICGSECCLLLDTGMGIGNIKNVVDELTDKEVFVVNCHRHFDHVGNNYLFENVYSFDDADSLERLKKGYSHEELAHQVAPNMSIRKYPSNFDIEKYVIPGCTTIPIKDSHVFHLGNRDIRVLHAPGHTSDSIVLHDVTNSLLFTGDVFYPAALYTHFADDFYGKSSFEGYMNTMDKLSTLANDLELLYCSHNEALIPPSQLVACSRAFHDIIEGNATGYEDEEKNKRYDFKGFSIIVK